ncbi:MAG: TetR family transcriptional regulator [Candidatus Nanopelagicales bacterium]
MGQAERKAHKSPADAPAADAVATQPHTAFRSELRRRALAEALRQLNDGGWNTLRMGTVAEAAGVSRPTLYAEFGNKRGLAAALVRAEAEDFLAGALRILADHADDPPRAIYRAVAYTFEEADRSRIVRSIVAPGPTGEATDGTSDSPEAHRQVGDTLLASATIESATILEPVFDGVLSWFASVCPGTDRQRLADAVDALIRLVSSHVLSPGPRTGDGAATLTRLAVMMLPDLVWDADQARAGVGASVVIAEGVDEGVRGCGAVVDGDLEAGADGTDGSVGPGVAGIGPVDG